MSYRPQTIMPLRLAVRFPLCIMALFFSLSALGRAAEENVLNVASNKLANLPVRAILAERYLQTASRDGKLSPTEARAVYNRCLRLAAKELRDIYDDWQTAHPASTSDISPGTAGATAADWAMRAETARAGEDYETTLHAYAQALNSMLTASRRAQSEPPSHEVAVVPKTRKSTVHTSLEPAPFKLPSGFEIVTQAHPAPLPLKNNGQPYGFVFNTQQEREQFAALPRAIRTANGFFSRNETLSLTFLLVPAGKLYFPDDTGRVRELINSHAFYLAAEETTWGALAAILDGASAQQRQSLTWNDAALRLLTASYATVANDPARFACANMVADFSQWLDRRASTLSTAPANDLESVFVPPSTDQWRFAACLDLLAEAEQDKAKPSYRWWKRRRAKRGWDTARVRPAASGTTSAWGFRHLFGNVAERTSGDGKQQAARRCGGSFRQTATPILSYPLYDSEARDGADDLGFRLILQPAFVMALASEERKQP